MSWLSKATGINIDLLHGKKSSVTAGGGTVTATDESGVTVSLPTTITPGSVLTALDPNLISQVEGVINGVLVKAGLGNSEAEIDALLSAEISKLF